MFDNPTAVTFCGYLLLMIALGFFAWRYVSADRQVQSTA